MYLKKRMLTMPNEKKVWADKIMVNCDVICGRTKKRCGVPSFSHQTHSARGIFFSI